jgi:uncharacterized repeat protein (TIGR03806 family)
MTAARHILLGALTLLLAAPGVACVGDCNGDGAVSIDELVTGVNLALGSPPASVCAAFDLNADGSVVISELVAAVSNATGACPQTTPTPTATPSPGVPAETRCTVTDGEGVNFDPAQPFCELLSSYRFFRDGARQEPNEGVLPYDLTTPLFSDYAHKQRFVWLPPGTSATYSARDSFKFPVGSVLIKTFAFPRDEREPELGERLIETRLLVRRAGKWEAITYLWNAAQTEARRNIIGKSIAVSYPTADGGEFSIQYQVPNTNQCKECHAEHDDVLGPLGPKARYLNKDHDYADGSENQLTHWAAVGYLSGAPDPATAPRLPVFDDPASGTLEERARAYLDTNCGHCHNPSGLARTSGLYLNIEETVPARYGVCKPPVAAGQGSGGRRVDILPGEPDGSILVYRMESTAPSVAMPELGRQTVHAEAVEIVREWIAGLEGACE